MTLWQTPAWEKFQQSLGIDTRRVEGILVLKRSLPLNLSFFEIQRATPTIHQWREITKISASERAVFCRYVPNTIVPGISSLRISRNPSPAFPDTTRIIDLQPDEPLIFASFSATGRRHIRFAERSGVYVEESSNATAFADLLEKTAVRGGFRAHNAAYFKQFLRSFGQDARLLVAKNDKQWLAAGIFTFVEKTSVYYYGASCNQRRELNAPTLLQWEAVKLAKRMGCTEYDLLGIARDEEDRHHPLAGVTRFKKKLNGEVVYYPPELDVIFAPGWYRIFRTAKTMRDFMR